MAGEVASHIHSLFQSDKKNYYQTLQLSLFKEREEIVNGKPCLLMIIIGKTQIYHLSQLLRQIKDL